MIVVQKTPKFGCLGYAGPPPKATKKAAGAEDELDLFGDSDDEAPKEDGKAARAAAAKAAKEAAEKKKKPKKIDKSLVTLVVKPWEAETDLDALF